MSNDSSGVRNGLHDACVVFISFIHLLSFHHSDVTHTSLDQEKYK